MLGLRAFAMLKAGRDGLFDEYINQALALTFSFAKLIEEAKDFELLTPPETNIICYRYLNPSLSEDEMNDLNQKTRSQLINEGDFFIVQVSKNGRTYLRSALMNPFITEETLAALLQKIREIGTTIIK